MELCNAIFINHYILNNHKKIPSITIFTKYKPNHIVHAHHLSAMACNRCTEFAYLYKPLMKCLMNNHTCGSSNCANYTSSMGENCSCNDCYNCIIFKYNEIKINI